MASNGGLHLPVVIIATFVSPFEAGSLFLVMRVVGTPISVISVSIGQIYIARLNRLEVAGDTRQVTFKICKDILNFVLLPIVFISPYAPNIFTFCFGEEWGQAGQFFIMMMPLCLFQALSSPISNLLYAQEKQEQLLYLSLFGLVIRTIPLLLCLLIEPGYSVTVFLVAAPIYYVLCLTLFLRASGGCWTEILKFYFSMFLKVFSVLGLSLVGKVLIGL